MKTRFVAVAGVIATTVSVAIMTVMVAGQAPPASAGTPARTAWGTPDVTGLWNSYTLTPLQRPAKYADRATLTDKEAAEIAKELADIPDQARSGNDEHDVVGAYNHSVFFDRVTTFTRNRTSLIVDPP